MLIFYLFLAILGLVVGSFLGMLSYRLPRRLSLWGRSFCDTCKKPIHWYENVPVVYFLWSWGKCGSCGNKIHWRYPAIELATAVAFVATGYLWLHLPAGSTALHIRESMPVFLSLFFLLLLITCYLLLIITDLEFKILPDEILFVLAFLLLLYLLLLPSPLLFQHVLIGFSSFIFFLFLYLITRGRGMGFGDVKLVFLLGGFLGWPSTLVAFFLAFVSGAIIGVMLLLIGRAKLGRPIPFGPYLLVGAWIAMFFGEAIFKWYLTLG